MKRIWKFPLKVADTVTIEMPEDSQVLTVQAQGETAQLWALVMPDQPKEKRAFFVVGTGHNVPHTAGRYVGTFQLLRGAFIGHVFEKQKGA